MSPPRAAAALRRERERDLVAATRALFDERGMLDAPIEEIARAVGIARGLIYRQFSSKEELFVLTVTNYLDELEGLLGDAPTSSEGAPADVLAARIEIFARFCLRYPAFQDNVLSLMHRPAKALHDIVSEAIWLRLGQGMAACIDPLAQALRAGVDDGTFTAVDDPEYTANILWTQTLGAMHLARIAVGVRRTGEGAPALFTVDPADVVATCVASALASAGVSLRVRE
ncbi:TetR/AcrR family transcriptional regulator [Paraconexibacter antarcticus]|uniref:TetR/AcrR family transcriptional regulator n=1 Tax=Paraconexibacter antarcticus TaxID=2949664 RepID=A0ABY5DNT3_9ACTN|nr:TetR/AcrR family transcriptional regulator [Paraconexibacter antarcticus]UTI62521.1 TetR/AcrR family transcriptional regulator [Paraconexibacter antarcticus]